MKKVIVYVVLMLVFCSILNHLIFVNGDSSNDFVSRRVKETNLGISHIDITYAAMEIKNRLGYQDVHCRALAVNILKLVENQEQYTHYIEKFIAVLGEKFGKKNLNSEENHNKFEGTAYGLVSVLEEVHGEKEADIVFDMVGEMNKLEFDNVHEHYQQTFYIISKILKADSNSLDDVVTIVKDKGTNAISYLQMYLRVLLM